MVKVSSKGQVVIPKEIREEMGIKEGTFVEFKRLGDKRLEPVVVNDPIEELEGILEGENLVAELELEHKREIIEEDEICITQARPFSFLNV